MGSYWPCQGSELQDFSFDCPEGWLRTHVETCKAPTTYDGGCQAELSFEQYSMSMRRNWATNCHSTWPQLRVLTESDEVSCVEDYSSECPSNWTKEDGVCIAPQ